MSPDIETLALLLSQGLIVEEHEILTALMSVYDEGFVEASGVLEEGE